VFGMGFLGAALSTYHLYFIRSYPGGAIPARVGRAIGEISQPGSQRTTPDAPRPGVGLRFLTLSRGRNLIRFDILSGYYGRVVLLLFVFHLAQFLAIPIFPLFVVNELKFSDQTIGFGTAMFNLAVFIGSTQVARLGGRWIYKKTTGVGIILLGLYPAMLTISQSVPVFAITSILGGLAWSLVGGALYNYLVDRVPADDRPAHMAWYNLALNAAILLGALLGASLANRIGLTNALLLYAAARSVTGLAILRWG